MLNGTMAVITGTGGPMRGHFSMIFRVFDEVTATGSH